MKKNFILTNILFNLLLALILASCGLNARFNGLEIANSEFQIRNNDKEGTDVGNIVITGNQCNSTSYSLKDDFDGYFKISSSGVITLAKDNPKEGTYQLVVLINCDGTIVEKIIVITITKTNCLGVFDEAQSKWDECTWQ